MPIWRARRFGKIQSGQLEEILADLKRYPSTTPIILGRDLKTKYFPSKFVRRLKSRARDLKVLQESALSGPYIREAPDWIFAKGPVKAEKGRVRRDFKGSDHYPIYTELRPQ